MATNTHTEVPAGTKVFPPFQMDTFAAQLVWLTISFVLLYMLVAKLGLPRVAAIIEERRRHVADDVAAANRNRAESHVVMAAYEGALSDARNRANAQILTIQQRIDLETKQSRRALEAELKTQLSKAEQAIVDAKVAAVANLRRIAVEAADAIVVQLTGAMPAKEAVTAAVDRALNR